MLNREKYAKEILDIACKGHSIAMVNGKLRHCSGSLCDKCDFNSNINCRKNVNEWANSEDVEPIEPQVDWSKVPVDTPIYVRCCSGDKWEKKHFAKFENNYVYAWSEGKTSWSTTNGSAMVWEHAKLAESEENHD